MKKTDNISTDRKKNGFLDPRDYDSLTDQDIVEAILLGETDLFEILLRRYNQQLYRIVRSYLAEEEEIKDVMQTAYMKAFEHLDQFKADAKFSTWLIRITINEALKHLNKNNKFSDTGVDMLNGNGDYDAMINKETPETEIARCEMKKLLEQSVETLSPKYCSVYIMREIEQMSTREVAECLGISETNVKVRLYRARSMLREELEKRVRDVNIFKFKGERCDQMVQAMMKRIKKD